MARQLPKSNFDQHGLEEKGFHPSNDKHTKQSGRDKFATGPGAAGHISGLTEARRESIANDFVSANL